MASQQTSGTLASEIILRARDYLNEAAEGFFLDSRMLAWLNEGTKDIVVRTHCLEQTQHEQLVENQLEYSLVKTGSHTGVTHATILTSSGFIADRLVGQTVDNITDGSSGTITANTTTTVTVSALTGGSDNQWEDGDGYSISYAYVVVKQVVFNKGSGDEKGLLRGNLQAVGRNMSAGEPINWNETGSSVKIYPKPNAANSGFGCDIDIITVKTPALVTSSDSVLVPACYDKALAMSIAIQGFYKDSLFGKAQALNTLYEKELDRYRLDFVSVPVEKDKVIK